MIWRKEEKLRQLKEIVQQVQCCANVIGLLESYSVPCTSSNPSSQESGTPTHANDMRQVR